MKKKINKFYWWTRKHISAIAFAVGFVWDIFTLGRIDFLYGNVVFILYLLIAFLGILLIHSADTRRFAPKFVLRARPWLPVLVQFPLGGLFSGFVIFYTKSASLVSSWPFLLILVALFIGNEFFKKRYERLVFQITLFYFALFSYLVLIVPVVLGTMGTATFVFSGILSILIIWILLQIIKKLFSKLYAQGGNLIWVIIGAIYLGFNVLYFTNTIPPVPLSLKEIGIYHSVVRNDSGYTVTYEKPEWYNGWKDTSNIFHRLNGEAVYCFSSVFAPTHLSTEISHSWQKKTRNGKWAREELIPFTVEGGRDGGYRGYTFKQNLSEGTWRCVVETKNKQVIGQMQFNIINTDDGVQLMKEIK